MTYVLTWLALMAFLALTLASSYLPMGAWNSVANLAISCAKALLINMPRASQSVIWRRSRVRTVF